MISVLDHIEYLCAEHDCVIVPGFGAFISQYSTIKSAGNGLIMGLRRNTVFNMSINNHDGLLANSIVRREKISYESAISEIDNYVSSLRSQLKYEGEIPVGRIGFFKYHSDELIEFFPFSSWNANNEYYGLSQLNIKPLNEEEKQVKHSTSIKVIPIAKRFMHIAASIILLIGLTFVLTTPVLEQKNQNYANLNAFTLKSSVDNDRRDLFISIPKVINTSATVDNKQTATNINTTKIRQTGNYCLVIASLATKKQAEKYIDENNLSDYEIVQTNSKYRIYIARGTFSEMSKLKSTKYSDSDAWVCHL